MEDDYFHRKRCQNNIKIWIYAKYKTVFFYNLWEIDSILNLFSLFFYFFAKQENSFNFKLLGRNELLKWLGRVNFVYKFFHIVTSHLSQYYITVCRNQNQMAEQDNIVCICESSLRFQFRKYMLQSHVARQP